MRGEQIELTVRYHSAEELEAPYERLLGDALEGDPSLFARQDTVEAAWRIVDPVLDDAVAVRQYRPGSWGPKQAARLAPSGWHDPVSGTAGSMTAPASTVVLLDVDNTLLENDAVEADLRRHLAAQLR